jgi:hypothetical protein
VNHSSRIKIDIMNALLNRKIIFERVGDIWGPSKRLTRELVGGLVRSNGSHDGVSWNFTGDPFWV